MLLGQSWLDLLAKPKLVHTDDSVADLQGRDRALSSPQALPTLKHGQSEARAPHSRAHPPGALARVPARRSPRPRAVRVRGGGEEIAVCGLAAPVSKQRRRQFVSERSDPKASHNVFAYKLADGSTRQSSDGEPGGTAGPPVLAAIEGSGLVDVVALVIRYYGGIKLGTGGLVRAYGGAAKQCLELGEKSEIVRTEAYIISYAHGDTPVFGLIGGTPTPLSSDDKAS